MRFFIAALLVLGVSSVSALRSHHRHHESSPSSSSSSSSSLLSSTLLKSPSPLSDTQLEQHFTHFIKKFNKNYAHDDFFPRFNIFKHNVEKIRLHNLKEEEYSLSVNEFADLTWEEFRVSRLGLIPQDRDVLRELNVDHSLSKQVGDAPTSIDWRTKGIVTIVKDQKQCGSCWAFSTTGSVEGVVAMRTTKLLSLSEQQLVDCSTAQGNQGCNGGLMDNAFQYIISNNGITTEDKYPYTASGPNTCNTTAAGGKAATISSYKDVKSGDEKALLAAVAQQPVSVAIEADQQAFQFYSGGVLTAACGTNLDHGVLAVGYGTFNGTDYWIVKNSWGSTWGEGGYIRLQRGINQCGIANMASYPIA